MVRFREVLFKKDFFSLWTGQIISEFGDRLNQMALIALVYSRNPGSTMALANLLFFIVVPVFVIGPVAGVYVDRWDRKSTMVIADILRGFLVLAIPIFVWLDMMVPVYIIVFLVFSLTRFFLPSKMAFIPEIVSHDKLMVANSLSSTTRMIATILGFALAGLIVKWVGYMWGFYLDSLSFFLSALFIGTITPKKGIRENVQLTKEIIGKVIRKNIWNELLEGFGYMVRKNTMRIVISILFLLMAGVGSIFCVAIVFVQNAFGTVTIDLGLLGVFLGIGLFLGTVIYGKFGQRASKIRTMFVCLVFSGVAITVFAFYTARNPIFWLSGILILLVGALAGPILTCVNTLIHVLIPDEARGRVFSSVEVVTHVAFLIFMFLTAHFSKQFSNFEILFASGIVFALSGLVGLVSFRGASLTY